MSHSLIVNGAIRLYDWIDKDTIERVCRVAVLPNETAKDWEGQRINVLDWKISDDFKAVKISYQVRDDLYAPILDANLSVRDDRFKLRPPTKSKNWRFDTSSEKWVNTKTGERAYP